MNKVLRNENSIIYKNEYQDFETGHFLSIMETQNFYIVHVVDSYYGSRFSISEHYQNCDIEITYSLSNGFHKTRKSPVFSGLFRQSETTY